MDIDIVIPNPEQPRKNFDEEQLNNLANSIKNVGLIQPITVVKKVLNILLSQVREDIVQALLLV